MAQWKGDLQIARLWNISFAFIPPKPLILVYWQKPPPDWYKLNSDGAVSQNCASIGGIIRNSEGDPVFAYQELCGEKTVFESELLAIKCGLDYCLTKGFLNVIVEADSLSVLQLIEKDNCPLMNWKWIQLMDRISQLKLLLNLKFTHIFREGNQVADYLAEMSIKKKISKTFLRQDLDANIRKLIYSDKSGIPYLRLPK